MSSMQQSEPVDACGVRGVCPAAGSPGACGIRIASVGRIPAPHAQPAMAMPDACRRAGAGATPPAAASNAVRSHGHPPSSRSHPVNRWRDCRADATGLPFSFSYAAFLLAHRGWPGETGDAQHRRAGDRSRRRSPAGRDRLLQRLPAAHRDRPRRYARGAEGERPDATRRSTKRGSAWIGGACPRPTKTRLLAHVRQLASAGGSRPRGSTRCSAAATSAAAQRCLGFASPARRPFTRRGSRSRPARPDADDKHRRARQIAGADPDAGIIMDQATALRNDAQEPRPRARRLATRAPARSAARRCRTAGIDTALALARGAANDSHWPPGL